jgi:D-alanine-D-alanine ligase
MSKRVAVIFGSRSVEHEVSVITAHQVMRALDVAHYEVIPIYISKAGAWFTGERLKDLNTFKKLDLGALQRVQIVPDPTTPHLFRSSGKGLFGKEQGISVDVVFPVMHGTCGEDGSLQGLLEMAGVAYVGCGIVGSAVGMDKVVMKAAFEQNGLPVIDYLWFSRREWDNSPEKVLERIETELTYPVFVKPANLGSSIGISKAVDREGLEFALAVASQYDRKLLVERSIEHVQEINCAVMGNDEIVPSACEEPISWESFLCYDDKYLRGATGKGMKGSQRKVPADISQELTRHIQDLAVRAFRAIDGMGTARVDLLVDKDQNQVFVNEVNTIPGSLAFHLWQPIGLSPAQVVDNLIHLALEAWEDKNRTTFSYSTPILEKVDLSQSQK